MDSAACEWKEVADAAAFVVALGERERVREREKGKEQGIIKK